MRRNRLTWLNAVFGTALGLVFCSLLTGCLVAGYSSGGGFWIWPGSLVITLILVLAWLLTRR